MAEKQKDGWLADNVKTIVYALLIAGVFRTLFFQPFWIPSGSMKDTLLIGDFLFVNKMAYGYSQYSCEVPIVRVSFCPFEGRVLDSEPERGDVVVFRHPTQNVDYIKRLIGMPGDTVQVREGRLFLNGTAVAIADAGTFEEIKEAQGPQRREPRCKNGPVGMGGVCEKQRLIETLPNGVSHSILNTFDNHTGDNTPLFTVPEDHYFFMGDNRDNSIDSRYLQRAGGVGYLHKDLLIGRADRIMFSSAGKSLFYFWTWRGDRFFKAVE